MNLSKIIFYPLALSNMILFIINISDGENTKFLMPIIFISIGLSTLSSLFKGYKVYLDFGFLIIVAGLGFPFLLMGFFTYIFSTLGY